MPPNSPTTSLEFTETADGNRSTWILVSTYIFLSLAVISVAVKFLSTWRLKSKLEKYDILILFALTLSLADAIGITFACKHGLGRHIETLEIFELDVSSKAMYAVNIMSVAALGLSKASNTLLNITSTSQRMLILMMKALLVCIAIWTVCGMMVYAFKCNLPAPWKSRENCIDDYAYYFSIGIVNILTDIGIVSVPAVMVWNMEMIASKRWVVSLLFLLRLLTPIVTVVALVTLKSQDSDPTWNSVLLNIWFQLMITLSIITACVLSFKQVIDNVRLKPGDFTASSHSSSPNNRKIRKADIDAGLDPKASQSHTMHLANLGKGKNKWVGTSHLRGDIGDIGPVTRGEEVVERCESVEGLTEGVILRTRDFKLEYEERPSDSRLELRLSRATDLDSGSMVDIDLPIFRHSTDTQRLCSEARMPVA